jgi:glycerophosphoryl diester phosphodiesterase
MAPWRWPRVLAHRCGGELAPENSLAGLHQAAAHRIAGVEFDVMLAACGTPVLIHDETLERTTDGQGEVARTGWPALAGLRLRDADGRLSAERLPMLAQALETCRALDLAANIEIKPATGHAADTGAGVARAVAEFTRHQPLPVLLSSFATVALAEAARVAPHLPRGLLVEAPSDRALDAAGTLGCHSLIVHTAQLDAGWAGRILKRGLQLAVYTENDPARARERLDWGVAGVISDRPQSICA